MSRVCFLVSLSLLGTLSLFAHFSREICVTKLGFLSNLDDRDNRLSTHILMCLAQSLTFRTVSQIPRNRFWRLPYLSKNNITARPVIFVKDAL